MQSQSTRKLVYQPALKKHCGNSLVATVLMQQLEYWFSDYPQGFYKFLSPCDHPRYKSGDSWVEELAITAHEFRSAFDKIGCRYKSKNQWQSMIDREKDPFQNRFYCSYLDVRSGLTHYRRHATRVDQLLHSISSENKATHIVFDRQHTDFSSDAKSASPEMKILHFQRFKKCISGSEKSASPIKETKMNYRDDTKKTAAIPARKKSIIPESKLAATSVHAAAVVDNEIGERLTSTQEAHLNVVVEGLLPHCPTWNAETLLQGMTHSLCDRNAYTRAGADFFKKLNTIQKAIRAGTWTLPTVVTETKQKAVQSQRAQLQQQWRELQGEYDHLQCLATSMRQKGNHRMAETLQQQIDRCCDQLRQIEEALLALSNET